MNRTNIIESIVNPLSYTQYVNLVAELAENYKSTGDQTPEHIAATKINAQRMKRIDKQCVLNNELKAIIDQFKINCTWVLLTESWCGDGAQCVPVIAKIAEYAPAINLQLILRDENPKTMSRYLTNGAKSIPKLICINNSNGEEIGVWGSRPKEIQKLVYNYKHDNPNSTHDEFSKNLHLWYAKDRTESLQIEFTEVLNEWLKISKK